MKSGECELSSDGQDDQSNNARRRIPQESATVFVAGDTRKQQHDQPGGQGRYDDCHKGGQRELRSGVGSGDGDDSSYGSRAGGKDNQRCERPAATPNATRLQSIRPDDC